MKRGIISIGKGIQLPNEVIKNIEDGDDIRYIGDWQI